MKELLVPVGNWESLEIAVKSGADAVYLAGKKFGARAFADNFTDTEMQDAIKYCHLYGVKIYVTVNTLVFESELEDVKKYIGFLHINGVDAVIVADVGLIAWIHDKYPNLEIHASTQVHNTNQEGIDYLTSLGVKRVVLAREMSLGEIEAINGVEKEVFIHGALCVCYSGQCLFSSLVMERSGNRGACAQPCRLPYKLKKDDQILELDSEYLLSPKELNTTTYFDAIMRSDIYSLKIEGRMKSSFYVGCVTRLYRTLIDSYYQTGKCVVDNDILNDLKVIFNREYTKGFLFSASNQELMNTHSPNHLGVNIGRVERVDNKYIYIALNRDLAQGDGIRFLNNGNGMIINYLYDKKWNLISKGFEKEVVLVDKKYGVSVGDIVNKTLDIAVRDKYLNVFDKKIPVSLRFSAHASSGMELVLSDGVREVMICYGNVEVARTQSITEESITKQLSKFGGTPFSLENIELDLDDNLFISIKDINEIRRRALDSLREQRENQKRDVVVGDENTIYHGNVDEKINVTVLVRNQEQLEAAISANVARIYVTDRCLYEKNKHLDNVLFRTYRVGNDYRERGLITELGAIKNGGIGDYFLNVTNHHTINELSKYVDVVTLSPELSDEEIEIIMRYYKGRANLEVIVSSHLELMVMKYCPLNLNVNKDAVCLACMENNKYYLVDRFDKEYPLLMEAKKHITHILNYKRTWRKTSIGLYKKWGINNYRIELLDENKEQALQIIEEVKEQIREEM